MQYMGGKSRIARPIAEIINTALTGGGSENLIVYQYWNGEQVTDTLTARNAGGGNGCQINKILIV